MITIEYLPNKQINVLLGMDRHWQRCFRYGDSIRTRDTDNNMLVINAQEVTFDFVVVRGAKTIRNGFTCIFIIWKAESSPSDSDDKFYLMKVGMMMKPLQNKGQLLTAEDFVEKHALVKFTAKQKEQWGKEGKLEIIKT